MPQALARGLAAGAKAASVAAPPAGAASSSTIAHAPAQPGLTGPRGEVGLGPSGTPSGAGEGAIAASSSGQADGSGPAQPEGEAGPATTWLNPLAHLSAVDPNSAPPPPPPVPEGTPRRPRQGRRGAEQQEPLRPRPEQRDGSLQFCVACWTHNAGHVAHLWAGDCIGQSGRNAFAEEQEAGDFQSLASFQTLPALGSTSSRELRGSLATDPLEELDQLVDAVTGHCFPAQVRQKRLQPNFSCSRRLSHGVVYPRPGALRYCRSLRPCHLRKDVLNQATADPHLMMFGPKVHLSPRAPTPRTRSGNPGIESATSTTSPG